MRTVVFVGVLMATMVMLWGCGGGSAPGGSPPPGTGHEGTLTFGDLTIHALSTTDLVTVPLTSPSSGSYAFTGFYGASMTYLAVGEGPGQIAFVSDRDSFFQLYSMNPATGGGQSNLTRTTWPATDPAWSPDGGELAFAGRPFSTFNIHTMNADGSGLTNLTSSASQEEHPTWSPDGSKIAFDRFVGAVWNIFTMYSDGYSPVNISGTNNDQHPDWSPDGTRIAFDNSPGGTSDIWTMKTDGTDRRQLTTDPANDFSPVWSPDGRKIAFVSNRDGNLSIYVMADNGDGQTRLTFHPSDNTNPTWSPDGTQIAFDSNRDGDGEIFVVNANGTGTAKLTTNSGILDNDPTWIGKPNRVFVGSPGSDGGADPPLGSAVPAVIVGIPGQGGQFLNGLAAAAVRGFPASTILGIRATPRASIVITPLVEGTSMAAAEVRATALTELQQDNGRGLAVTRYSFSSLSAAPDRVLVYFNSSTGRVAAVLPILGGPFTAAVGAPPGYHVERLGDTWVFEGNFAGLFTAAQPQSNLARGGARRVVVRVATGEVVTAG